MNEPRTIGELLRPILNEAKSRTQQTDKGEQTMNASAEAPELLTAEQAAHMLQIGTRSLWRKDASGQVPQAIRIGKSKRWRRGELLAWIRQGCPPRHRWRWAPKK